MKKMKDIIQNDKIKINNSFEDFKHIICNIISDFKSTLNAKLDFEYLNFVNEFKDIKKQYKKYSLKKR